METERRASAARTPDAQPRSDALFYCAYFLLPASLFFFRRKAGFHGCHACLFVNLLQRQGEIQFRNDDIIGGFGQCGVASYSVLTQLVPLHKPGFFRYQQVVS